MNFSHEFDEQRFFEIWTAVRIERPVNYSLFTFGDQQLELLAPHLLHGLLQLRWRNVRLGTQLWRRGQGGTSRSVMENEHARANEQEGITPVL